MAVHVKYAPHQSFIPIVLGQPLILIRHLLSPRFVLLPTLNKSPFAKLPVLAGHGFGENLLSFHVYSTSFAGNA